MWKLMIAVALVWGLASPAQAEGFAPSTNDAGDVGLALLCGAATVGSVFMTIANGYELAHDRPSKLRGDLGIVFGAILVIGITPIVVQDDWDVSLAAALPFYILGVGSAVLGVICHQRAPQNEMMESMGWEAGLCVCNEDRKPVLGIGLRRHF
jgi:hypothetical protein